MNNQYHPGDELALFDSLKPFFLRRFSTFLQTLDSIELSPKDVDSLSAIFFDALFSEGRQKELSFTQLQTLFDDLTQKNIDLNQILSHALLLSLESYTAFLGSKIHRDTEFIALNKAIKDYFTLLEHKLSTFAHADEQHKQKQRKNQYREIIALLQQSHETDGTVVLTNTFRGITVSYEARIIALNQDQATFEVHKYQAAAMTVEKSTLISATFLPKPVRARVASINTPKMMADLRDFAYFYRPLINRERLRLQPDTLIPVTFTTNGQSFRGTLMDISINGMGVLVEHHQAPAIETPVQVQLTLVNLPRIGDREVNLPAKVINQLKDPKGCRMGLLTYPNFEVEEIISKYLAHMQTKILHDLQWRSLIG